MSRGPKGVRAAPPQPPRSLTEKIGSVLVGVGAFTAFISVNVWAPPIKHPVRSIPGFIIAGVGLVVWAVGTVRSRRLRSS
jgi:hypothetical protein